MKTQISKHSFDKRKRYSAVYQQQGRMITDADWNELSDIAKERLDEALRDAVGSGAPKERGVELTQAGPGQPLRLAAGRVYAEGLGADVVAASDPAAETLDLDDQADFPEFPAPPNANWVAYADLWERPVISLEDPDQLRDAALHGADTTTRSQTMAQIKWCPAAVDPEDAGANPPAGDATLSLELRSNIEFEDPCDPCAVEVSSEGRTGNYLFRLEVHDVQGDPAAPGSLTLKWSSENGAEQHDVGSQPPAFEGSDWSYEFFDDITEKHLGVHLAPAFSPAREPLEEGFPADLTGRRERVRRWDGFCVLERSGGGVWSLSAGRDRGVALPQPGSNANPPHGFVQIGSGLLVHLERVALELTLEGSTFVAGDYWLVAVREATDTAGDPVAADAPPHGVRHRYLRLGSVDAAGALEPLDTPRLRQLNFPPLSALDAEDVGYGTTCDSGLFDATHDTVEKALDRLCQLAAEHVGYTPQAGCQALAGTSTVQQALDRLCGNAALFYVSGDGQEGDPGAVLPAPLEARVAVGRFAEAGRRVRFRITAGPAGQLTNPVNNQTGSAVTVASDGTGLARVEWRLDATVSDQRVEAVMVDQANNPIGGRLAYNATHRGGDAADLGVRIESVEFRRSGAPFENEMTVPVSELAGGLVVNCDQEIDPACFEQDLRGLVVPGRPNFEVSVYVPFPLDSRWGQLPEPAGFDPIVLAGVGEAEGASIHWRPRVGAETWLQDRLFQRLAADAEIADRLLVHVRLRGNFIWVEGGDPPEIFLDGESFGRPLGGGEVGITLPSGNRRSGGTFEAWFWVTPDAEPPATRLQPAVRGNVVTALVARGDQPQGGVVVELLGANAFRRVDTTRTNGRASFANVPNGTYTLRALAPTGTLTAQVRVGPVIGLDPRRDVVGNFVFDRSVVDDRPVTGVTGVGPQTAVALQGRGIQRASDLAMADPRNLVGDGMSLRQARRLVSNARELLLTRG